MSENCRTSWDRDTWLESFGAELTSAAYPVVLPRVANGSWLSLELSLWKALTGTVKGWAWRRPPAGSAEAFAAWREELLAALTESAFSVAVQNGVKGPRLAVELCLYRALRLVIRRHSRVN
jgi:hypothetical protein